MDGAPRLGSRRVRRLPAPAYRLFRFAAKAALVGQECPTYQISAAKAAPTAAI